MIKVTRYDGDVSSMWFASIKEAAAFVVESLEEEFEFVGHNHGNYPLPSEEEIVSSFERAGEYVYADTPAVSNYEVR